MKYVLPFLLVLFTGLVNAQESSSVFGADMPEWPPAISLSTAVSQPGGARQPTDVRITGRITEVCQKKGCWMMLIDGDVQARVTFEDYGFFVPKDIGGRDVVVFGRLSSAELSAEQANHYESDAGRRAIHTSSVTEYNIVARSVQIN